MPDVDPLRVVAGPGVLLGVAIYGFVRHKTYEPSDLVGIAAMLTLLNLLIAVVKK